MTVSHISPEKFSGALLNWYQQYGRKSLPWQLDKTPYKVWLSEIMLQQTQVTTVIPYFEKFMARFPTVTDLAQASIDEVLSLWTGLGYYARARNCHRAAQMVVHDFAGQFPDDLEALMQLPGVGRSTAGAIRALAHQKPAAILDGNVKRVLARTHQISGNIKDNATLKTLWELSDYLTPQEQIADYTQAIMDIGALICTRRQPNCEQCPFKADCLSYRHQTQHEYPINRARGQRSQRHSTFLLFINDNDEVLLHKRPNEGIWGGLWCFPTLDKDLIKGWCRQHFGIEIMEMEAWQKIQHNFTHFELTITPILVTAFRVHQKVAQFESYQWHKLKHCDQLGLSTPVKKLLNQLNAYQVTD